MKIICFTITYFSLCVELFLAFIFEASKSIFVLLFKERTQKNLKLLKLQCPTLLEAFETFNLQYALTLFETPFFMSEFVIFHLAATNTFSHTSFSFSIFIHLLQTLYFWVEFVLQREWWKKNIRTRT